jgi:hypothetical protein
MRRIGFSTGALVKGDFRKGLELQRGYHLKAIELSALRERELPPLVEGMQSLDLSTFDYVSIHAPGIFHEMTEGEVIEKFQDIPRAVSIVVHPNALANLPAWRVLGSSVCIENMDQRKKTGRTVSELRPFFEALPDAGFCLDVGHAHQVDPTMGVAIELLIHYGHLLRHLHVSEVDHEGKHKPMTFVSRAAFEKIEPLLPDSVPLIIESVVTPEQMAAELGAASEIFVEKLSLAS